VLETDDDLAELAAAEADLDDLDVALRRLDEGTYGTCEVCGETLGEAALAERPLMRRCAVHG
jgi:RNA polymerase-binding transcription factor DksA